MNGVRSADPGLTHLLLLVFPILLLGCEPMGMETMMPGTDGDPAEPDVIVQDPPPNPLAGEPGASIDGLSAAETVLFDAGKALFESQLTADAGLGPGAIESSCESCHGQPAAVASGGTVDFRFVAAGGGGEDVTLRRNASRLLGIGLLERVSDDEILSRVDFSDIDGDGVTGRVNIEGGRVGRFGRKAQAATIESIARGMLVNQMGVTSDPLGDASAQAAPGLLERVLHSVSFVQRAYAQAAPPSGDGDDMDDGDGVPDPEYAEADLAALVSFLQNAAAPLRGEITEAVLRGEVLFASLGCAACHVPTLMTTDDEPIHPYSDFLLHNMGPGLADDITRGAATGELFRTQPLWGLRNGGPYLHDGRADSVEQAIDAHGGEAEPSVTRFDGLNDSEQQDLLAFLNSL